MLTSLAQPPKSPTLVQAFLDSLLHTAKVLLNIGSVGVYKSHKGRSESIFKRRPVCVLARGRAHCLMGNLRWRYLDVMWYVVHGCCLKMTLGG